MVEKVVHCGECGAIMYLKHSRYGMFYGCSRYPDCNGTHCCHPDGNPMGKPANKETKILRHQGHELFSKCMESLNLDKGSMYKLFADSMGMDQKECHFGMFDKAQCEQAISLLRAMLT